jgi:hypothetical protein
MSLDRGAQPAVHALELAWITVSARLMMLNTCKSIKVCLPNLIERELSLKLKVISPSTYLASVWVSERKGLRLCHVTLARSLKLY